MIRKYLAGMLLMAAFPFFLSAQEFSGPVSFSLASTSATIKTGDTLNIVVNAEIEPNWHLYSLDIGGKGPIPTSFTLKTEGAVLAGNVTETPSKRVFDPNFQIEVGWHSNTAQFTVPVVVLDPAVAALDLAVRFMACDDKNCTPPMTRVLRMALTTTGEDLRQVTAETKEGVELDTAEAAADFGDGFWSFIWIALTAGFAALLTPCVFPMIPLTVSYFTKQAGDTRARAIGQALLFGLSIIGTFTVLGVLLSLFIGASGAGQFASNPWVNLFIGLIFIVFAFSLLGLFELQLPYQVTNFLNRKSQTSSGFAGLLFMGLTISAVSFSCTAPFVGGVLAATATGAWFYPIVGMIAFSLAFSTPFVIFAVFPNLLASLPRSGSWMNTVKVMLGFVELAAAFKFVSNADLVWQWGLISRPLAISFWIAISLVAGMYMLGKLIMPHEYEARRPGFGGLLSGIGFVAFAVYLLPGLMGASLGIWDAWLPPKQATDVSLVSGFSMQRDGGSGEVWISSYEEGLSASVASGKPVFIDFTGYTCTNCRAMEANVFPLPEIQSRFEQFEKVQLYTDDGVKGADHQLFQFKLTGTVSLPTYAIVDPRSGRLISKLSGYSKVEEFQAFLDRGLKAWQSSSGNQ
jgi:thiol:disulfide interchange protein DsbD